MFFTFPLPKGHDVNEKILEILRISLEKERILSQLIGLNLTCHLNLQDKSRNTTIL